jgi:hypothetical protein
MMEMGRGETFFFCLKSLGKNTETESMFFEYPFFVVV